jgi:hypothetical protein
MKVRLPDGSLVTSIGEGACAFCDGLIALFEGEDTHGVFHTLPYCETFDRLEVPEFVHKTLEARGIAIAEEGEEN